MENQWYFVINPISGKGKGLKFWHQVKKLLDQSNITYSFGISEYHTHTTQLIKTKYQEGIHQFIGLGGDGTVNEILNGIFNAESPSEYIKATIGLFPIGTGNDWIRNHQELTADNLIERLRTPQKSPHDVGVITTSKNHYFLNVAGGGLDGMVVKRVTEQFNLGKKNAFSYIIGTLKALLSFNAPQGIVLIDQKEVFSGKILLTTGSVGKFFGNGMQISPKAKTANGLLDFSIVKKDSNWVILPQIYKLFNGKIHSASFVKKQEGKVLRITCENEIPLQADGEGLGHHTEFEISVIKHGIMVLE